MFLGIVICCGLGLCATWLGGVQHVVGAPVIGMFLGMLLSNLAGATITARFKAGAAFASKTILRLGIIRGVRLVLPPSWGREDPPCLISSSASDLLSSQPA